MIHMIQNAKTQAAALTLAAYRAAVRAGVLPEAVTPEPPIEIPKDKANGDFTTTFALAAAKSFRKPPRAVAQALAEYLDLQDSYFSSVEIAGPGFLNFRLNQSWYTGILSAIEQEGADYGKNNMLSGQKIMVEFVSANPTGPMHMGNARGGVLGDTLASVLSASGAEVSREFYVNDAGNQIDKFARSIYARCVQLTSDPDYVFPEDGYQGDDIRDLASAFLEQTGEAWPDDSVPEAAWLKAMSEFGLHQNIPKMRRDLERYKIQYDAWFFESSLHESHYVSETMDVLSKSGWTYEKDGALWLKTSEIIQNNLKKQGKSDKEIEKLDLKDDVLRRANGFYTYFAVDIAYHRNKFSVRRFDRVIDVWGADHHGHVARLKAAMDALGIGGEKLEIVLMQLVKLLRDGEVVRMSKRTGKAISLTDLLDEVPVDAARWFFNAKPDTQMDFDLGLAVREDSENPIYYVEYAHARICSLLRMLAEEGESVPSVSDIQPELLSGETEQALLKQLAQYCEEVRLAARDCDPSHINRCLQELAGCFHRFYNACRIKGEEKHILQTRLKLADCTRIVLRNGLKLIGVDAPEKM